MHACCLRQLYLRCAKQGFGAPEGLPQSPCVWRGLSQGGKDISSACMRMCHKKETLNKSHLPRSLDLKDVKVVTKLGGTVDDSELVDGMVFDHKARGAKSGNLDTLRHVMHPLHCMHMPQVGMAPARCSTTRRVAPDLAPWHIMCHVMHRAPCMRTWLRRGQPLPGAARGSCTHHYPPPSRGSSGARMQHVNAERPIP